MTHEDLIETLKRIGLSSNESRVYLTLLRIGSSKAGKISKETHINRTTTYDVLKILLEKGLISYVIKANNKWFEAVDPKGLLDILKEKENDLQRILPELKKINNSPKEKHNVKLFYGYKGIKSVFQDIIKTGKDIMILDSECYMPDKMLYYTQYFVKQLNKRKVKIKHLVREDPEVRKRWGDESVLPSKLTEVKFVPLEFKSNSVIDVYGDRVAIIIWSEPPEAVIIQNKSMSDVFRSYFEILWNLKN
jgi:sugar-specific transcriptional regulator TrmB